MAETKVTSAPVTKKETVTTVIAMDGSEFSDYALTFYVECLHKPGNHTILTNIAEHKGLTLTGDMSAVVSNMAKQKKEEETKAAEFAEHLTKKLKELEIDGSIERISGDPGPAIIDLAKEKKADYIIVGCRGTGTTRKTVTGSVTDFVSHHSHVPVLIARNQEHIDKLHQHAKKLVKTHDKPHEKTHEKKHVKHHDKPNDKPDEKKHDKPQDKTNEKAHEKQHDKPHEKPNGKTHEKAHDKPHEKTHDKPHEKAHDKPHDKAHDKPHEKAHEKPHGKAHDKAHEKPHGKANDKSHEKPHKKEEHVTPNKDGDKTSTESKTSETK